MSPLPNDDLRQPGAYTVSDDTAESALRCVARHVPEQDRDMVAQVLGLKSSNEEGTRE